MRCGDYRGKVYHNMIQGQKKTRHGEWSENWQRGEMCGQTQAATFPLAMRFLIMALGQMPWKRYLYNRHISMSRTFQSWNICLSSRVLAQTRWTDASVEDPQSNGREAGPVENPQSNGREAGPVVSINNKEWGYYLSTLLNMPYSACEILEKPVPLVALKAPGDMTAPDRVV